MASSSSLLAHPAAGGTALAERETIRALLLERRPDLERRLLAGPSGAVLIRLAAGRCIGIGRMRRRGAARRGEAAGAVEPRCRGPRGARRAAGGRGPAVTPAPGSVSAER